MIGDGDDVRCMMSPPPSVEHRKQSATIVNVHSDFNKHLSSRPCLSRKETLQRAEIVISSAQEISNKITADWSYTPRQTDFLPGEGLVEPS